jgi:hypothetical protein
MMSNACQVGRGVRKPEASNGAMNMSRYISKSVLLLTLSVVICCGLYTLFAMGHRSGHFSLSGE